MGKLFRGKRDGTGPYKDSWQEEHVGIGKRLQEGEECPLRDKPLKISGGKLL